jgi:hypothetical protein
MARLLALSPESARGDHLRGRRVRRLRRPRRSTGGVEVFRRHLLIAGLATLAAARPASGQLCHAPALPPGAADHADHAGHGHHGDGPRLDVEAAVAVDAQRLTGGADVQGVTPSVHAARGRLGLRVTVPTYRIDRDADGAVAGLGDVALQGTADLLAGAGWRAGVALGAGLPTGSRDDGLGMGHLMVMPGVWAAAQPGQWRFTGSLSLGASVQPGDGDGHDHHHGHTVSVVNPMNRREVGASLRAGRAPVRHLELYGLAVGAAPIGDGVTRAAVGAGARWQVGAWSVGAEADAGVIGRPFIARGVLDLARHF